MAHFLKIIKRVMLKRNSINLKYEKEMTLKRFCISEIFWQPFRVQRRDQEASAAKLFSTSQKTFSFLFFHFWISCHCHQCDQIGQFLKYFVTYVIKKVARMYCDFLGYFKNINYQVKVTVANFGVAFGKFGQLFISTYGHTGRHHLFSTL